MSLARPLFWFVGKPLLLPPIRKALYQPGLLQSRLDTSGLQSTRVYGDKTLLNIVFNTLIDNAGKYSINTRRPINVSGGQEPASDLFHIEVSNYGLPIDPEEAEAIFDKARAAT